MDKQQAKTDAVTASKLTHQTGQVYKSVVFNLKQRRPGPAYNSPQGSGGRGASRRPQSAGEQHKPSQQQLLRQSCPTALEAGGDSSLQRLQALKQKKELTTTKPSSRIAKLDKLKQTTLARRRSSADDVSQQREEDNDTELHQTCAFDAALENLGEEDLALLHRTEHMLAGCTAGAIGTPAKIVSPTHMQLARMPNSHIPESKLVGILGTRVLRDAAPFDTQGQGVKTIEGGFQIGSTLGCHTTVREKAAASRDESAIEGVHAILSTITYPASPRAGNAQNGGDLQNWYDSRQHALSLPRDDLHQQQQHSLIDADAVPRTLHQALCMLGLAIDEGGQHGSSQQGDVYMTPLWLKLRAAAVVAATKREAAGQELRPVLARLRHVRANLEFHKSNANKRQGRTLPEPQNTVSEKPWLSGRCSAVNSKHRRARSVSPGRALPPRPKVAPVSKATSELQIKLLSELQPKLWQKLCFLALRHAAAAARLHEQLLVRIELTEAGKLCIELTRRWRTAAIPTAEMVVAANDFHARAKQRAVHRAVLAWRDWAPQSRRQTQRVYQGLGTYHRNLQKAALAHWKAFCQQKLVERLQWALASRWLKAWCKRKAFATWCTLARRAVLQKEAMKARMAVAGRLQGAKAANKAAAQHGMHHQSPTFGQSMESSRAAFQAVKDFVGAARQELQGMRAGLRFCPAACKAQEAAVQHLAPPVPSDTAPVGSLAGLLTLLQPPPQQQQQQQPLGHQQHQDSRQARLLMLESPRTQHLQQRPAAQLADRRDRDPFDTPSENLTHEMPPSPQPPAMPAWPCIDEGSPGMWSLRSTSCSPAHPEPPSPAYDPARYASPAKHGSRRQLGVINAEMDCHLAAMGHIREELDRLEQEATQLKQQQEDYVQQQGTAEQESAQCLQGSRDALLAKQEASAALQATIDRHTQASAECASIERQLQQHQALLHRASSSAAVARAAANATMEQQALLAISIQKLTKQVEAAAKELARCHRSRQPAAAAQLKEARQQLQDFQQQADLLQSGVAEQQQTAKEAAQQANLAEQASRTVSAQLVTATQQRQQLQQDVKRLMQAQERHAVEAVAQEQASSAAAQRQRVLCLQVQHVVQRLQSIAAQVLVRQRDAEQLQLRVRELEAMQQTAAAAALQLSPSAAAAVSAAARRDVSLSVPLAATATGRSGDTTMHKGATAGNPGGLLPAGGSRHWGDEDEIWASEEHAWTGVQSALPSPRPERHGCQSVCGFELHPSPRSRHGLVADGPSLLWSEGSGASLAPSSSHPPSPRPRTLEQMADLMYRTCLLGHAFGVLRLLVQRRRSLAASAEQHFAERILTRCMSGWRQAAAATTTWVAEVYPALRRRSMLRQWGCWVRTRRRLRGIEDQLHAGYCRRLLLRGFLGLQNRVHHQRWRDAVHLQVVRLRWRNQLRGWRGWTRKQRVEAASLRRACALYDRRLCMEAWQQWAWLARNRALLRRVFQTAADLWREEVGVLLHTRNFQAMRAVFDTWQLRVLELQELRRQQILWNAAAAFREKLLLLAGLQAFGRQVQAAREHQRMLLRRGEMFVEWRRLSQTSPRHWDLVMADNQRRTALLKTSTLAWRSAVEDTAYLLARFWLQWQLRGPMRRTLLAWRAAAKWQKHHEQQNALALALRRVIVCRNAVRLWRKAISEWREQRILAAMADTHCRRALALKSLHLWRAMRRARMHTEDYAQTLTSTPLQTQQFCNHGAGTKGPASPLQNLISGHVEVSTRQTTHLLEQHCDLHTVVVVPGARRVVVHHRHHPSQGQQVLQNHEAREGRPGVSAASSAPLQIKQMMQAVEQWKGAAEYWRQRLSQPSNPSLTAKRT